MASLVCQASQAKTLHRGRRKNRSMAALDDQAKLAAVGDVLEALTFGNLPALQRRLR